jgi:exodeoxyribonuclease III
MPLMRIVVWNCNMALGRKLPSLQALNPDVAIISEASESARLPSILGNSEEVTYLWRGRSLTKGLGVLATKPYVIEIIDPVEQNLEWVIPIKVSGPISFTLLAVWAMNQRAVNKIMDINENRQARQAVDVYAHLFADGPVIVAGDFNDAVFWDKPGATATFAGTAEALASRGLISAYHSVNNVAFGSENEPTIYWRDRTVDGPQYHIDYCFIPKQWAANVTVRVGAFRDWVGLGLSDHVPLIVDVAIAI